MEGLPVIRGSMTLDPVYNTRIPGSTEVIVLIMLREIALKSFSGIVAVALATCVYTLGQSRSGPVDPGVRGGPASAGTPLKGLRVDETAFFQDGQARFAEIEVVTKGANNGLGPRFNSNQCFSCHSQPDAGGSSPAKNPLPAIAGLNGATPNNVSALCVAMISPTQTSSQYRWQTACCELLCHEHDEDPEMRTEPISWASGGYRYFREHRRTNPRTREPRRSSLP
jgi:hypothetical protein